MKKTLLLAVIVIALSVSTAQAQYAGWTENTTTNVTHTGRKVGVGHSDPRDVMQLYATTGLSMLVGDYASFGSVYSSWSTVVGNNVRARRSAENVLENINTHTTYAGSAIVLNGSTGITFHTKEGAATAGAAYDSPRMVITSGGNVGIGLTNPGMKLSVNGTIYTDGDFLRYGGLGGNPVYGWGVDSWHDIAGGRVPYVIQHHTGLSLSAHSAYGGIRFFNQSYPSPYSGVLAMSITNGNVGIGTATPNAKLDVAGHLNSSTGAFTTLFASTLESPNIIRYGGITGNEVFGWGIDNVRDTAGGRQPYVLQHHTGLNFAAHSAYGGIRFYNQGYPTPYNGVLALAINNGNVGVGTPSPTSKLHVEGDVYVSGNIAAKYQDVAEWVPATTELTAGTVVVLNALKENEVMASSAAYDTTVAGVVSARPGLILGDAGKGKAMIATTGRVKVRVSGPVKVGDLLVTSDKPGMAMVSTPVDVGGVKMHRPGTIIGKALQALPAGEGEVLVLLSLQ